MERYRIVQTDHESDYGRWTLFRRRPPAPLAGIVHEMQGYFEEGGEAIIRREVPSAVVPLILVFGPGFTLQGRAGGGWRRLDRSFVAGLHREHVLVGSQGRALCLQVDFTPWGAQRFLRCEMSELADKVVDLNEVAGTFADRLEQRLAETALWETRFDIVEDAILSRIAAASDENALVSEAWRRIERAPGEIRIERLARDLDCSRKHLASMFRQAVGLSPKRIARIFRFEQAMQGLAAGHRASLAELAFDCGYADQAHFNRDFLAFSGETPRDLQARILPDGTGIMAR